MITYYFYVVYIEVWKPTTYFLIFWVIQIAEITLEGKKYFVNIMYSIMICQKFRNSFSLNQAINFSIWNITFENLFLSKPYF